MSARSAGARPQAPSGGTLPLGAILRTREQLGAQMMYSRLTPFLTGLVAVRQRRVNSFIASSGRPATLHVSARTNLPC